jgi:hypothetical protein
MVTMKKTMSLLLASFLFISAIAQSQDEAGVRECLQHYMSGQADRVEKAFHPSATMKYIDLQSKEFKDVPIADYITRVKANSSSGARNDRKIEIVSLNVEGSAAQAKIKIETEKAILYDYMNLLKINGEWKIVSKIFSRQDK